MIEFKTSNQQAEPLQLEVLRLQQELTFLATERFSLACSAATRLKGLARMAGSLESMTAMLGQRDRTVAQLTQDLQTIIAERDKFIGEVMVLSQAHNLAKQEAKAQMELIAVLENQLAESAAREARLRTEAEERKAKARTLVEAFAQSVVQGLPLRIANSNSGATSWLRRKIGPSRKDMHGAQSVERRAELLRRSGLFDHNWYLNRYPDVRQNNLDPVHHYLEFGATEGRDPGPLFSTVGYAEKNPDVAAAKINPLVHYIWHGSKEGRPINIVWDL